MRAVAVVAVVSCLAGCGGKQESASSPGGVEVAKSQIEMFDDSYSDRAVSTALEQPAEEGADEDQVASEPADAGERKIIYTASVDLVVKDLRKTETELKALVKKSEGEIAQFHQDRRYGDQLETSWTVRIPVDNFETFVETVCELGVPESRRIESMEVTEQYIDLAAGLENAKRTEKEYQKFLEDRSKTVEDVASIYEKLGTVRREIDSLEGRLRHLSNRIRLTTVTILAREDRDYTPPQAPNFATTIKETFGGSLEKLEEFGKGCVLFLVAVAPWLPIALVVAAPAWYLLSRRRRARRVSSR